MFFSAKMAKKTLEMLCVPTTHKRTRGGYRFINGMKLIKFYMLELKVQIYIDAQNYKAIQASKARPCFICAVSMFLSHMSSLTYCKI